MRCHVCDGSTWVHDRRGGFWCLYCARKEKSPMLGKRRRPEEGEEFGPHRLAPGEYTQWNGEWYGCTPNGLLAGLRQHHITEHADGTITVAPSILCSQGTASWHGYLKAGIWEEC